MPTEVGGEVALAVLAGDVLALRGAGLAAAETWALLCQAAQALQDLFLSNGGVVGGSGMGPVVTPHTLELTPRGRVTLRLAPPETARAYLPPEYRPGRMYSDTDSEKMWMYSLGRALLDTTPRGAALTGTVSVSPSSALQSVLAAMTEPDPHRRASLMNLLDVISEYCRTRLQTKPFSHIVMDMYREVVRSPQYAARKRASLQVPQPTLVPSQQQQQTQHPPPHFSKYQVKGALFKAQSRNSRSQPNLLSLSGCETSLTDSKPEFQSQLNIQTNHGPTGIHHARTNSQPAYTERTQGLPQTRSNNNLLMIASNQNLQSAGNIYSDPIYTLPVKQFLSSQDVRVNGLTAKSVVQSCNVQVQRAEIYAQPTRNNCRNGASSQPNIVHLAHASNVQLTNRNEEIYFQFTKNNRASQSHHRQSSNPQLPSRNQESSYRHSSQPNVSNQLKVYSGNSTEKQNKVVIYGTKNPNPPYKQRSTQNLQQNPVSSTKTLGARGAVPPKPPRIITTLKRAAPPSGPDVDTGPPVKPPRSTIKNGPRARRGKAVQRAPSRLYRAIGGPSRSFNKTQCVGPEFVVRANQPPKQLVVGDVKVMNVRQQCLDENQLDSSSTEKNQ